MCNGKNIFPFWICLICTVAARPIGAAFMDWFWTSDNDLVRNGRPSANTPMISIPYESKTEDEKFLEEALKFTDLMKSSALDLCQHNVVLKIKTSCSSMTEEELAKLSVNLLNCQSSVDGRRIFPCSDEMTLKDCTEDMDANMWNAYHMMNNRARAVCLASRRSQFQALTEMTVNKLLSTAQDQVSRIAALQEGQEQLEILTAETMGTIREGNIQVMLQQKQIQDAQKSVQNFVAFNLKELTREKALIASGHRELAEMTEKIKIKLDEANKELLVQSLERSGNHQKVIEEIDLIRKQSEDIFQRIDDSTSKLLAQHELASKQYQETLRNLWKINATVGYLTQLFSTTHDELDKRIDWIKSYLGESGEELQRVSCVVLHVAYLFMGMLIASFLHLPLISRVALVLLVPLNLLLIFDQRMDLTLDFAQMTFLLMCTTLLNLLVNAVIAYTSPPKSSLYLTHQGSATANGAPPLPMQPLLYKRFIGYLKYAYRALYSLVSSLFSCSVEDDIPLRETNISSTRDAEPRTPSSYINHNTAPSLHRKEDSHNLVSRWLDNGRFTHRSATPVSSVASGSPRNSCTAICRNGRRCKNTKLPGVEFCHRHETGSSVMG